MEEVIVQEKKLLVSKLSLSLVSVLFKPSPWSGLQPQHSPNGWPWQAQRSHPTRHVLP